MCYYGELDIEDMRPCATNAVCVPDESFHFKCVCIQGFTGDGYTCEREIFTTSEKFEFSRKLKLDFNF